MYFLSRWRNPTYLCGPENYPISRGADRAENGTLHKLGWTYRHDTVFAPRQCLYQKEPTGIESPEVYSTSQCKNLLYLCGLANCPV